MTFQVRTELHIKCGEISMNLLAVHALFQECNDKFRFLYFRFFSFQIIDIRDIIRSANIDEMKDVYPCQRYLHDKVKTNILSCPAVAETSVLRTSNSYVADQIHLLLGTSPIQETEFFLSHL